MSYAHSLWTGVLAMIVPAQLRRSNDVKGRPPRASTGCISSSPTALSCCACAEACGICVGCNAYSSISNQHAANAALRQSIQSCLIVATDGMLLLVTNTCDHVLLTLQAAGSSRVCTPHGGDRPTLAAGRGVWPRRRSGARRRERVQLLRHDRV